MGGLPRFVAAVEGAVRLFGAVAALSCIALVLLVAGDVFVRYFFRTGAVWFQELQWHLISPIALFGMSYALYRGEQVRVDFLLERFPAPVTRALEVLGGVILMAMSLYIVWLSAPWVHQSFLRNEGSPNPGGMPWRWALKALIPLGFVLLALQGLAHALRHGLGIERRDPA